MAAKLSGKQEIFVAEMLDHGVATRAYIAAGYSATGAAAGASRLLSNVKIQEHLNKKQQKRLEKYDLSAERVLAEIVKVAFLDPRKFFNPDGSLKQITELDDDTAAALAGMDVEELFAGRGDDRAVMGSTKKVKIADKLRALEMLGKHLKLFTDKVELAGKDGGPVQIEAGIDLSKLKDEQLEQLESILKAAANASGSAGRKAKA